MGGGGTEGHIDKIEGLEANSSGRIKYATSEGVILS